MDRHELNEMFDGLAPGPGREGELLHRLLQDDMRRKKPMKNWKRVVAAAAAAALMVTGAAAAVVLPRIDPKVLDHLNVDPEDTEAVVEAENLLLPGAMELDITKESNGATLHVTQILRDRNSIMILADFTAPEGTVLDIGLNTRENQSIRGFTKYFRWMKGEDGNSISFMDENGNQVENIGASPSSGWENLDDGDPRDNHLTLMFEVSASQSTEAFQQAKSLYVPTCDLAYYDDETQEMVLVYPGDWSFEVPLPQKDTGWTQRLDCPVGELDGGKISVGNLYVSPMTLEITLKRDVGMDMEDTSEEAEQAYIRWLGLVIPNSITLTTYDGETITLDWYVTSAYTGEFEDWERAHSFTLSSIIDPSKLQGGTITVNLRFDAGSVTIPLDNLTPVEP